MRVLTKFSFIERILCVGMVMFHYHNKLACSSVITVKWKRKHTFRTITMLLFYILHKNDPGKSTPLMCSKNCINKAVLCLGNNSVDHISEVLSVDPPCIGLKRHIPQ
jgi:hypothetical protein